MKRIVSCLLSAFLLLCLLPVQVMAAGEAVRAELVLENSGQTTADNRAVYNLQFRLFGEQIGNVAMAYIAIDNTVFEVETPPTTSFRSEDLWMDGATATATVGNVTYLRLEVDRGTVAPLHYSNYTEASYTSDPAIATVQLILKTGATATANAVRFITAEEAAGFNAPSAVFACSKTDFYLYNAVSGATGKTMGAAVTMRAAEVLTPKPDSNLSIDTAKGYLTGVKEETTVAALKAQFTNSEATLRAFDKNGVEITDPTQKLGTGSVVKLMNGDTAVQSVTIVVKGDVNGDADVTSADAVSLLRHVLNVEKLSSDAYVCAGETVDATVLSTADVVMVLRTALGMVDLVG